MPSRSFPSLLAVLVLALGPAACASDPLDSPTALFPTGCPDELQLASDLAWDELTSAPDSPARDKGIQEFAVRKVNVDDTGMAHTRVQQLVHGVPVWEGEAIVHLAADGSLAGYTDDLLADVKVDTTPEYTSEEAIDLAVALLADGGSQLSDTPLADLWVLRSEDGDHLVWRVQLKQLNFQADDAMPVLFIDAHTGKLVWSYNNFQTSTCSARTNFYGTVSLSCYHDSTSAAYYLEDTTRGVGTYSWGGSTSSLSYISSSTTTMSSSSAAYKNANEAQYVAAAVYDYYSNAFGRDGIDGAGGPAYITSHGYDFITSTTSYSSRYENAYWDPTDLYMTYGDGDGSTSGSLTTLDIGGHEFTHGVTQYEANLTYSGESGALNEAISDIFGSQVERSVLGESASTWTVGEATWTPSISGDAARYMDDPAADGGSYDYYSSRIATADVHYGSGVANLAFYLLADGGSHPRGRSTTVVTAIGADDAAAIWYLALTSYMTSSTSYSGARTATLSAAGALYGTSSQQYRSVGDAWTAVGVGGSSSTTCTSTSYTGSISAAGNSAYRPSAGTSVSVASQTATLTGPSTANFNLYLQKKSGGTWTSVASSTGSTSSESIRYSGTSGTYRMKVYSASGSGSYSLSWCK